MRPFRNEGSGRSFPLNTAPLLKNQLQDLDMELEILKRQREIIKQRQMETQFLSQGQNMYNQPSSSFVNPELKLNNYANSYTNSFNANNKNVRKGNKRPSDRNWQPPSGPKLSRPNPWENLYDYRPSNNPLPLMKVQTPHYKKTFPHNKIKPRTDFNPTKVTKAKNVIANKVNTNSNIPKTAKKSLETKAKKASATEEILRPFEEPTASMKGRLELALGDITKNIKQSTTIDKSVLNRFNSAGVQRYVKNLIRQRISNVMMNKVVGTAVDVIAHYRKEFPNDIDEEIINTIKDAPVLVTDKQMFIKPISAAESGKIREFFKTKINFILKDKIEDMIKGLTKLYGNNESEILKCIEDLPDIEEVSFTDNKAEESKDKVAENQVKAEGNENKPEENKDSAEEHKDNAEENKEITNSDKAEENKDNEPNATATNSDSIDKNSTKPVEAMDKSKPDSNIPVKPSRIEQYTKLMDLLIANRLPKLMTRFKEDFLAIMYSDKDFVLAKEKVMKEVREKLKQSILANSREAREKAEAVKKEQNTTETVPRENTSEVDGDKSVPDTNVETIDSNKETNSPQNTSPKYVMLLGRPALPSKPLIHEFLNKFNPQSIKKHKTVNNLLVIGFNNDNDYNNILAANDSKVGDATFVIKANEVLTSDKQNAEQNESADAGEQEANDLTTTESTDAKAGEMKENGDAKVADNSDKGLDNLVTIEESDENDTQKVDGKIVEQNAVKNLKDSGVATPTRSSTRLATATPSKIQTRRASRLAQ